jgi:hypothetical protein
LDNAGLAATSRCFPVIQQFFDCKPVTGLNYYSLKKDSSCCEIARYFLPAGILTREIPGFLDSYTAFLAEFDNHLCVIIVKKTSRAFSLLLTGVSCRRFYRNRIDRPLSSQSFWYSQSFEL